MGEVKAELIYSSHQRSGIADKSDEAGLGHRPDGNIINAELGQRLSSAWNSMLVNKKN